ncbi:hypothetical protein E8E13_000348 [Curvularia kusanoi]|uniref:Uncharacterized protein n=1 Tax=Curvularia kusanoi TaxID=90978 RepID=A0A9P4T2V2_CURKU|nr:hypothetical protein E8E13_000348 [Curvularia kusanoi]
MTTPGVFEILWAMLCEPPVWMTICWLSLFTYYDLFSYFAPVLAIVLPFLEPETGPRPVQVQITEQSPPAPVSVTAPSLSEPVQVQHVEQLPTVQPFDTASEIAKMKEDVLTFVEESVEKSVQDSVALSFEHVVKPSIKEYLTQELRQVAAQMSDMSALVQGQFPTSMRDAITKVVTTQFNAMVAKFKEEILNKVIMGSKCTEENAVRALQSKVNDHDKDIDGITATLERIAESDKAPRDDTDKFDRLEALVTQQGDTITSLSNPIDSLTVTNSIATSSLSKLQIALDGQAAQLEELPKLAADLAACRAELTTTQETASALDTKVNELTSKLDAENGRVNDIWQACGVFRHKIDQIEGYLQHHGASVSQDRLKKIEAALPKEERLKKIEAALPQLTKLSQLDGRLTVVELKPDASVALLPKLATFESKIHNLGTKVDACEAGVAQLAERPENSLAAPEPKVDVSPELVSKLEAAESNIEDLRARLDKCETELPQQVVQLEARVTAQEAKVDPTPPLVSKLEATESHIGDLAARMSSCETEVTQKVGELQSRIEAQEAKVDPAPQLVSKFEVVESHIGDLAARMSSCETEVTQKVGQLESVIASQQSGPDTTSSLLPKLATFEANVNDLAVRISNCEGRVPEVRLRTFGNDIQDLDMRMNNCENGVFEARKGLHNSLDAVNALERKVDDEIKRGDKHAKYLQDDCDRLDDHREDINKLLQAADRHTASPVSNEPPINPGWASPSLSAAISNPGELPNFAADLGDGPSSPHGSEDSFSARMAAAARDLASPDFIDPYDPTMPDMSDFLSAYTGNPVAVTQTPDSPVYTAFEDEDNAAARYPYNIIEEPYFIAGSVAGTPGPASGPTSGGTSGGASGASGGTPGTPGAAFGFGASFRGTPGTPGAAFGGAAFGGAAFEAAPVGPSIAVSGPSVAATTIHSVQDTTLTDADAPDSDLSSVDSNFIDP